MENTTNPLPQILRLDATRPDDAVLEVAAAALRAGELVILPTETVYGLAADPQVEEALPKLWSAKNRPSAKPITRLVAAIDELDAKRVALSPHERALAEAFWPGPLTLVLGVEPHTEGYRIPNHPVALSLLKKMGRAVAVTSANPSGEAPALTADDAVRGLGASVSVVLDAGASPGGVASTVVRCAGRTFKILRQGAISEEALRAVL